MLLFVNVLFNHSLHLLTYLGEKEQGKWFSYLDIFRVFYYCILILGKSTIKSQAQNPIWNFHTALRSISQGCLSSRLSNGTRLGSPGQCRSYHSFLLGILVPCLQYLHAACSRQLLQKFSHPQSTHATVRTLLSGESTSYFIVS